VISKKFNIAPEIFARIPDSEKYIFQGSQPGSIDQEKPGRKVVKNQITISPIECWTKSPREQAGEKSASPTPRTF
jgi:hypothetical protein